MANHHTRRAARLRKRMQREVEQRSPTLIPLEVKHEQRSPKLIRLKVKREQPPPKLIRVEVKHKVQRVVSVGYVRPSGGLDQYGKTKR
jgi:hypothetical protein